jgi:2,4-dienoyl-CoA reductase-like NADH-dependent reductase (Old Yellow Enzyme family)
LAAFRLRAAHGGHGHGAPVQAHSGRKGSVSRPWEGTQPLSETDGALETVCPSAVPFGDRKTALREMDEALIAEVKDAFRQSTRRA